MNPSARRIMTRCLHPTNSSAFGRLELVMSLAALALLALVTVPLLAQDKPRTQMATCLNNLRLIGRALLSWNADHDNFDPWRLSFVDGGTQNHPSGLNNNCWFQFAWLSNELRSPKILACPSDASSRPAFDFTLSPQSGFLNVNHRNLSVSYFLGLDSVPVNAGSVLAGDRSITIHGYGACSSGVSPCGQVLPGSSEWLNTRLHGGIGNLLFHDGRAEPQSNAALKQAFRSGNNDNGVWHVLLPGPPPL